MTTVLEEEPLASDRAHGLLHRTGAIYAGRRMKIDIITDRNLIIPEYIIDFKNKSKKTIELLEKFEKLKNLEMQKKEDNVININDKKKFKKKSYRKRKFYKKAR